MDGVNELQREDPLPEGSGAAPGRPLDEATFREADFFIPIRSVRPGCRYAAGSVLIRP
jgi:hypothetical protein